MRVKSVRGLQIELFSEDITHAKEHLEVTIEKIIACLQGPDLVITSKHKSCSCLFYKKESEGHYFCVVVDVLRRGVGRLKTAYESNYIKKGTKLYER